MHTQRIQSRFFECIVYYLPCAWCLCMTMVCLMCVYLSLCVCVSMNAKLDHHTQKKNSAWCGVSVMRNRSLWFSLLFSFILSIQFIGSIPFSPMKLCVPHILSVCMRLIFLWNDNDSIFIRFGLVWWVSERYGSVVRLQLYVKQHHHCIRLN